jgi:hypothetical protein
MLSAVLICSWILCLIGLVSFGFVVYCEFLINQTEKGVVLSNRSVEGSRSLQFIWGDDRIGLWGDDRLGLPGDDRLGLPGDDRLGLPGDDRFYF